MSQKLPAIFDSFFQINDGSSTHITRQIGQIKTPFYKTTLGNKFIKKTGVELWNELATSHNCNISLSLIKKLVKAIFFFEY